MNLPHLTLLYMRFLAALLATAIMAAGCSTMKHTRTESSLPEATTATTAKQHGAILKALVDNPQTWDQLQVPVKITLVKPQRFSISGRLYMIRGERIYASMRFMGIEVATLDVQPDSIHFYDKFHRKYVAESIASLMGSANVTIGDLQDLLLGRLWMSNTSPLTAEALEKSSAISWSDRQIRITPNKSLGNASYSFIVDRQTMSLDSLTFCSRKAAEAPKVEIAYSSPLTTDFGMVMQSITASVSQIKTPVEASITTNFKSVKWQANSAAWDNRPQGYDRVSLSKLITTLKP